MDKTLDILKVAFKDSSTLGMPVNSKCSMLALLLRLLRAAIVIIAIIVQSQITMIFWGEGMGGWSWYLVHISH